VGSCVVNSQSSGSHNHAWATIRLAATVGALLLLLAAAGQGADNSPAVSLSAQLEPGELTHKPAWVRRGARGRFSATFSPYGTNGAAAHYSLSTQRLTAPALTAHIHTGTPGRDGPVLLVLCNGGRCNLSGALFQEYPKSLLRTMRLLGAYVDVHTKRNPRGELRGQIVVG
jgi:hypothetical protein